MKKFFKKLLKLFNFEIDSAVDRGISLFGTNIRGLKSNIAHNQLKGANILQYCLKFKPINVLDVGAGSGKHAEIFANNGSKVLCIDYETSIYAKEFKYKNKNIQRLNLDFNNWENNKSQFGMGFLHT